MGFERKDLEAARDSGILSVDSFDRLTLFLQQRKASDRSVRFDLSHLLWYAGALIVIAAMGLFSTTAFSLMGGKALVATAVVYAVLFTIAGGYLWHRKGLTVPGGLMIAVAISMAPMAVYGVQDLFGYWNHESGREALNSFHVWVRSSWLPMEIATLVVAGIALRFFPFPFIVFIAAFALWYMSMDLTAWLFNESYSWSQRKIVSVYFGLAMLVMAWVVDLKRYRNGDFAFWLHLFGLLAFWGGLSAMNSDSELSKAVYCLINVVLILLAVFLQRKAYAVFGAIGVSFYLGHLADRIFKNSLLFPFALSLIGILIIGAGLLYYRNRDKISAAFEQSLPKALKALRPAHTR